MVRPPLERPIPAASAPLLRGRIRVGLANGGVDKHVSEARIRAYRVEKTRPNARNRSVPKPGRPRAPVARFRRQIAPRRRASGPPQDRAEEQSIVRAGPPVITLLARNQGRDDRPLPVGQDPPAQDRRPFSILNETEEDLGIPEMQTLPRARGLNTSDDT